MSFPALIVLAVGLSADAFAVALGKGLQMRRLSWTGLAALAVTFALFQAAMPVLGWAVATRFADYVTGVDHWVAFGLLAAIGAKMLHDALIGNENEDEDGGVGRVELGEPLLLGLATSIDALAVGISFAFLDVSVVAAAALIGVTTLGLSAAGVLLGHRVGVRFRTPAEVVGGLVLIGIGVKVLLDHLA
jgi:putative Mn2+ efflux pump MntP